MNIPKVLLPTLLSSLTLAAFGQGDQGIQAPNVVAISETLVTSGQPTPESLANLSKHGFQAVIYLAPPSVPDAVANEPEILRGQGLTFVNIPIQWSKPTEADFQSFVAAMKKIQGQKTLVHCQANMRASAMTFLYRVITLRENPAVAYEAVHKVWIPKNQWKDLMNSQLQKAKIPFEVK
jgi:protein tyrosine phosphatase (PTP) superfamily phosphohydrolase (DUF442 family)